MAGLGGPKNNREGVKPVEAPAKQTEPVQTAHGLTEEPISIGLRSAATASSPAAVKNYGALEAQEPAVDLVAEFAAEDGKRKLKVAFLPVGTEVLLDGEVYRTKSSVSRELGTVVISGGRLGEQKSVPVESLEPVDPTFLERYFEGTSAGLNSNLRVLSEYPEAMVGLEAAGGVCDRVARAASAAVTMGADDYDKSEHREVISHELALLAAADRGLIPSADQRIVRNQREREVDLEMRRIGPEQGERSPAGLRDCSKGVAKDPEENIVYEKGPFYAFKVKTGIEIRKNGATHATLVGTVPDQASAVRFIDRAARYPNNF